MIRLRRSATAAAVLTLGAVVGAVLGFAAPAAAHVTVNPGEANQGGYARLAFRVPNESDEASTTKVEVFFPEDAPVASVTTMPVPGWTVAVEKRAVNPPLEVHGSQVTEAVAKITWTASSDDTGVKPGEFQEFPVSAGPLPQVDQMVFRALQTYSDGNVVRWIDPPAAAGGEEPASPAPVLRLAAAPADGAPAGGTPSAGVSAAAVPASSTSDGGGSNAWGIAGLVAGLAGLVLGGLAYARTRRVGAPPAA
ncbi:YcnI family protein [Polymorphospora sp. NPDC050346]|uniref:YcnI family copper-binding membrane protein n=1 Tax=Polymorphospora sp. NPDC050346 TaxID=3155780 RepID=UPI0033DC003B